MRLIVTSPYRSRGVAYRVGEVLDLPDGEAAALLADSPGSFAVEEQPPAPLPATAPIDGVSPANRAISRAPRRKAGG